MFPLLGYTVIASLQGIEVGRAELLSVLAPLGLAPYLPALPEPRTSYLASIGHTSFLRELTALQ